MGKRKRTLFLLGLLVLLIACDNQMEKTARDVAASLGGAIKSAQGQYLDTCRADATQNVCIAINRAVSAQNALISSIETYCGWPAGTVPASDANAPKEKCVPVKSSEAALQTAIDNAKPLIAQIQGVLK